jgi:hypothetical protein
MFSIGGLSGSGAPSWTRWRIFQKRRFKSNLQMLLLSLESSGAIPKSSKRSLSSDWARSRTSIAQISCQVTSILFIRHMNHAKLIVRLGDAGDEVTIIPSTNVIGFIDECPTFSQRVSWGCISWISPSVLSTRSRTRSKSSQIPAWRRKS